MDENQSDLALPDITEAEHLGRNDVENDHENGDQVNGEWNEYDDRFDSTVVDFCEYCRRCVMEFD